MCSSLKAKKIRTHLVIRLDPDLPSCPKITILSQHTMAQICKLNTHIEIGFSLLYIHLTKRKTMIRIHPGTSLIKNYHFVLVHHFVPISPYCPKMKNTLICQWNFPFEACFGLSYIHVSQILRKK